MGSNVIYEGALLLSAEELPVVCTLPPPTHSKGIQKLTASRLAIKSIRRFNMDFVVGHNPSCFREKPIISLSANDDIWFYQKGILECLIEHHSTSLGLIYDGIITTSVHSCSNIGLLRVGPYLHMPSSYSLCQRYLSQ